MARCGKIWLSDTQRDDIIHRGGDIKITPDAGRSKALHALRYKVVHKTKSPELSATPYFYHTLCGINTAFCTNSCRFLLHSAQKPGIMRGYSPTY
jgi:hypothetical protein